MKYRDILGFSKPKKKVIKEQSKPKKNKIIESVKTELNEWYHQPPKEKRWSKKFGGDSSLTEFEQNGGKDNLTEAKVEIVINLKDFDKVKKLVKKIKGQLVKHSYGKKTFGVKVDKNGYNKALEILIKNKINPGG